MTRHRPESEEALAETVRAAAASGTPLAIEGGGTRGNGAPVIGETLSTAGLTGITLYEPGALTLVARSGTPLPEIEAALAAENQQFPFEPWDGRALSGSNGTPTLGGMVAVNASGPRRLQAGACRDSMIGVRFVDGTGAVVKNGGRVMKNVTGLDLVKLMAGSHGTLGVITEIGFKVLPRPEATATVMLEGLDVPTAIAAMTAATATPYDVTGAAHLPGAAPATRVRVQGFAGSVAYRAKELQRALSRFGSARIEEGEGEWTSIRDALPLVDGAGAIWRISVQPTDGARVAAALPDAALLFDWAGGLVWARVPENLDLRAALDGIPGHATLLRGAPETHTRFGTFQREPAPVAALAAGLRARFDPSGIFNPGRMETRTPEPA